MPFPMVPISTTLSDLQGHFRHIIPSFHCFGGNSGIFSAVTSQLAADEFEPTMSSFDSNYRLGAVAPLKLLAFENLY